jgi:hypothetical protein
VQAAAGTLTEVAFLPPVVAIPAKVVAPLPVVAPVPPSPPPSVLTPAKSEPYWNGRRTVGVVIGGAGVVAMVVGAVVGTNRSTQTGNAATALTAAENANPGAPKNGACVNPPAAGDSACTALSNALNSNGTDAHIEETLLIGGAVLVAVGLVTTFWPAGPEGPPAAQLAPITGPHVAGLQWSGSF